MSTRRARDELSRLVFGRGGLMETTATIRDLPDREFRTLCGDGRLNALLDTIADDRLHDEVLDLLRELDFRDDVEKPPERQTFPTETKTRPRRQAIAPESR